MCAVVDLTHVVVNNMLVHAYDERPKIEQICTLEHDKYNDWRLTTGMHVGTHIDGPGHLSTSPTKLSDLSADIFVGKGCLIDARGKKEIDAQLLEGLPDEPGLIVLIMTGWGQKFGTPEYFTGYPTVTQDFARGLIERKVKMLGIDMFSPDDYPFPVHKLLLENNILIVENLANLEKLVGVGRFTVCALPLKTGTDSALARVVALRLF